MIASNEYHAHVYFEQGERLQAQDLCTNAVDRFDISMGRMHDRPVGPHPLGSCQLTIPVECFSEALYWLDKHRSGLTVMIHSLSGDDLMDHTEGVIWLGRNYQLDLSVFSVETVAE